MNADLVLVTGGSGFVGVHCIDQLLRAGYRVRTTVRSSSRETDVRAMLMTAGTPNQQELTFVTADLAQDAGWPKAVAGCRYVHHVASPFPRSQPKREDDLIVPARDGALRVLRAARDAGVERVVLTSSFVAIGYGRPQQTAHFDESDWTNVDGDGVNAYAKSKTIAERAAWNFIKQENGKLELSVVNPVGIFGPTFGPDFSNSVLIIQRLLGGFPFCPRISFGAVDVRDVADIHLRAMTNPNAKGERFLACAGEFLSLLEVSLILRQRLGTSARRSPTREIPDWLVRAFAFVIPDLRQLKNELGTRKSVSNEKAKRVLGWQPRSNEDCIVATAESLQRLGLLKA